MLNKFRMFCRIFDFNADHIRRKYPITHDRALRHLSDLHGQLSAEKSGVMESFTTIDGMNHFFANSIKHRLTDTGQLLVDSSDLIYLFQEDDGSFKVNLNDNYHGEVDYFVRYKEIVSAPFKWLYVSYDVLAMAAEENGLKCEKVIDGEHYDYLARITL